MREQDCEAARARAEIERRRHRGRIRQVRRKTVGQQFGNERARYQHALVDVKTEIAKPRLVRQVCSRYALIDATAEQRTEFGALGGRQFRIEELLEAIERQMQRVQQQVCSFVVRIRGAVAERESSLVEARYGVAQEVAQRLELGRWTHGRTSCDGTSSRSRIPP